MKPGLCTVALLAALALAGCGGGGARGAASSRTFIDVVPALPSTLDPAAPSNPTLASLETSLAGTLVRPVAGRPGAASLPPPTAVTGYLARAWRILPDGDAVFDLRSDAVSAFGHTLSGADVRYSFVRELSRSAAARALAGLAGLSIADPVTVLSRSRVRINVVTRRPLLLAILANYRFAILDSRAVRAHGPGWLRGALAFYGAYELEGFVPGVRVLLVANPRYWAPLAFAHVAIEASPSAALRLADVGTRSASHTSGLDWATFAVATRTAGVSAALLPSTTVEELVPGLGSPLAGGAARRALSAAIDRAAIARGAFGGFARAYGGYDPALARRLLAAGRPLRLTLAAGPALSADLRIVAGQLRSFGVAVRTRVIASAATLAALLRRGAVSGVIVRTSSALSAAPVAPGDIPLVSIPSQSVSLSTITGYGGYATQATYYDLLRLAS